jgi:4-hydroxybenzoate polyprenyltransferase
MKIINFFIPFLFLLNTGYGFPNINKPLSTTLTKSLSNNIKVNTYVISKKINSIGTLVRAKNIIPTLFISFSSGWIMNPSLKNLLLDQQFLISTFITNLIMLLSMILNDLFDVKIDKINNPDRPFITGEISKKEGIFYASSLILFIEYLSIKFLPYYLQLFVNITLFNIFIYSPILKYITFIKNITCATVISMSSIFVGLATNSIFNTKNIQLLLIFSKLLFFGSFYNEILLDIHDYDGDKKNNIETIPIIYGKKNTLKLLEIVLFSITPWICKLLFELFNMKVAIIIPFLLSPLFNNLIKIEEKNFEKETIKKSVNETNTSLFSLLFYFCFLAKKIVN